MHSFSMREGLPNVVCEAMLSECIPVGFSNGGIPVAIGDAGYILKEKTIESAKKAIRIAMKNEELGKAARQRIIKKFPMDNRIKFLHDL